MDQKMAKATDNELARLPATELAQKIAKLPKHK